MLIQSGVGFMVLGVLIMGSRADKKLKERMRNAPVLKTVTGNLGALFFIIGILLLIAGLFDLYY